MSDYEGISPETAALATIERHITQVQAALLAVRQELEMRGTVHDASKLSPEEFPGFARINATARQHEYGSDEYKASMDAERPIIDRHQLRNSHHPEAHPDLEEMGWLDIIEMVCDWWAATQTYGNTPWEDALELQRKRWDWTPEQWWLIQQVAAWLPEQSG